MTLNCTHCSTGLVVPMMLCLNGLSQQPVAFSAHRNTTSGLNSLSLSVLSYSAAQAFTLLFKPICESELPPYVAGTSDQNGAMCDLI